MSKLKTIDYVFLILCAMGIRSIIDANVSQALIVVCFSAIVCFNKYLEHVKKPDIAADLVKQIEDLRGNMSGLMIKNAAKPAPDMSRKISF
jgi:hypothetical protein